MMKRLALALLSLALVGGGVQASLVTQILEDNKIRTDKMSREQALDAYKELVETANRYGVTQREALIEKLQKQYGSTGAVADASFMHIAGNDVQVAVVDGRAVSLPVWQVLGGLLDDNISVERMDEKTAANVYEGLTKAYNQAAEYYGQLTRNDETVTKVTSPNGRVGYSIHGPTAAEQKAALDNPTFKKYVEDFNQAVEDMQRKYGSFDGKRGPAKSLVAQMNSND